MRLAALALLLVVSLGTVGAVSAAKPRAASSSMTVQLVQRSISNQLWGYLVEHQSPTEGMDCLYPSGNRPEDCSGYWVVNPLYATHAWNIDDVIKWRAYGSLDGGDSFAISEGLVADNKRHLWYVVGDLGANRQGTVTVSMPLTGAEYVHPFEGQTVFCVFTPQRFQSSPNVVEIPNSNGGNGLGPLGWGIPDQFTVTLSNVDHRNARDAGVSMSLVYPNLSALDTWCGGRNEYPVGDGGFKVVGP